jgi:hypothetical protein
MTNGNHGSVLLIIVLAGSSHCALAQTRPFDQTGIVDSFKQKLQEVLKSENSQRGPEHAELVSRNVEIPAPPTPPVVVPIHSSGLAGFVNKDGSPCKVFHTGRCYQAFADNAGTLYVDNKGVPCAPEKHQDTCTANGLTAAAKLAAAQAAAKPTTSIVWGKRYTATVSEFGFDVRVTDSLVTPYTGVFTYKQIVFLTAEHATKEEAEKDRNFTPSSPLSCTETFGQQEGKWVSLDAKCN